jgi:mercuric ion transport protein
MRRSSPLPPPQPSKPASPAPALLTFGGLVAAFGVAACCGLPLILAGLGFGTAWLGGVALFAEPHRQLLLVLAVLLLIAGGAALWRQHRAAQACRIDGVCARSGVRLLTLAGLLIGSALLVVGYLYV